MNSPSRGALRLVEHALRLLAIGEHGVGQRLAAAHTQALRHVRVAEVPAELAPMLVSIRERLCPGPGAIDIGALEAHLERMEPAEAVKLAADIFDFGSALALGQYH